MNQSASDKLGVPEPAWSFPKASLMFGGCKAVTLRIAVAVFPTGPWSTLTVTLLFTVPTVKASA